MESKFLELVIDVLKSEFQKALEKDDLAWREINKSLNDISALFERAYSVFRNQYRRGNEDIEIFNELEKSLNDIDKNISKISIKNEKINKWLEECLYNIENGKKVYNNEFYTPDQRAAFIICDLLYVSGYMGCKSLKNDNSKIKNYIKISGYSLLYRMKEYFQQAPWYIKAIIVFFLGLPIKAFILFFCDTCCAWKWIFIKTLSCLCKMK